MPVSAVVADHDVLGVLKPGQHGSTFGGNALACAIGLAVVQTAGDRRLPGARCQAGRSAARSAGSHGRSRRGRGPLARLVGRR